MCVFTRNWKHICPEYNAIKFQITRNINKKLPHYVTKEFYEFKKSEFNNLPITLEDILFMKYNEDIFFITGIYIKYLNNFYTTSFSILKNKEQATYKMSNKYSYNTIIILKNFHCDYEKGISNAAEKIFTNINIKYYIWNYKDH
ncbi:hypothetical protein H8356DRAFT_1391706 [Neocallimastix lanati (nom. inval.)]|nr:hypothetical protein H8356DRAFT_1391706 [Neocallimastix sp. JGI-2020a]